MKECTFTSWWKMVLPRRNKEKKDKPLMVRGKCRVAFLAIKEHLGHIVNIISQWELWILCSLKRNEFS
jgi:hypothetical protein